MADPPRRCARPAGRRRLCVTPQVYSARMDTRHPSTQHLLDLLATPPATTATGGGVAAICDRIYRAATAVTDLLNDGPELTVALRHLLDARDALLRQESIDRG